MRSDTHVVILAGGKGTRLRPFTASFPKPLVPLGDKPILEVLLRQLSQQGFGRITLSLGHLSSLIRAFVSQQKTLCANLDIDFVEEETPTGTAGSLASIEGLDDTFLVMNGDVLTDMDFSSLVSAHKASDAALTIATHRREVKIDLGVLDTDAEGRIVDYREKPTIGCEVSMGVYAYEPRVLKHIKRDEYLDFPDLVLRLIAKGETVRSYRNNGFWLDIGRPEDYSLAQDMVESRPGMFGLEAA